MRRDLVSISEMQTASASAIGRLCEGRKYEYLIADK